MILHLTHFERELILDYGYPNPDFREHLEEKRPVAGSATFVIEEYEVEMLVGDLSRSINHGQVPDSLLEDVDALASRLELLL